MIDFKAYLDNERIANILRAVMTMMMMLVAFFLGYDGAGWTSGQIQEYCIAYNNATCMNCAASGFLKDYDIRNADLNVTGVFNITS